MKINYGDIIVMRLDPILGSEIAKTRPCIVISRSSLHRVGRFLIVVPVSSNVERSLPFHVIIPPSRWNGLHVVSKAMTEQMRCLDMIRFVKKIGSLEPLLLQKLEERILFILNQRDKF